MYQMRKQYILAGWSFQEGLGSVLETNLCLPRSQRYENAKRQIINLSAGSASSKKLILEKIDWLVKQVHKVCLQTGSA